MDSTTILSPSILSSDFLHLGETVGMLEESKADWIHLDVMDGVFVPNISFGFQVIKDIARVATKPLDVHLMIVDPDRYIPVLEECGAEYACVHYEACTHLNRTLQNIHAHGMKAGVALNPHTPVSAIEYIAQYADMVLIMSVNPGFGGQHFIENTVRKVAETKALLERTGSRALIEVDGGVTAENAKALVAAGADALVAGSAVMSSPDPKAMIDRLKSLR